MTKVLLLGDSIRISYQPQVAELTTDEMEILGPADNCQYSLYTLSSLDKWLEDGANIDIIHWNNGLHDCGHNPFRSPVQIPIDMYISNLTFIYQKLTEFTDNIIWATTTPVHPERPFSGDNWSWRNQEIDEYNEAAVNLMKQNGVPINDLNFLISQNYDEYLCEDRLHLSESGIKICARAVAASIIAQINVHSSKIDLYGKTG